MFNVFMFRYDPKKRILLQKFNNFTHSKLTPAIFCNENNCSLTLGLKATPRTLPWWNFKNFGLPSCCILFRANFKINQESVLLYSFSFL